MLHGNFQYIKLLYATSVTERIMQITEATRRAKYRTKKLGDAKTHLHTVRDSIEFYADDQSQHEKCSWLCVHAF